MHKSNKDDILVDTYSRG